MIEKCLLHNLCRVGHHSTSDDSSAYRSKDEVEYWSEKNDPIVRLKKHLMSKGYWDEEQDREFIKQIKKDVLKEFGEAEKRLKPNWLEMFQDVYKDMPPHLMYVTLFITFPLSSYIFYQ